MEGRQDADNERTTEVLLKKMQPARPIQCNLSGWGVLPNLAGWVIRADGNACPFNPRRSVHRR